MPRVRVYPAAVECLRAAIRKKRLELERLSLLQAHVERVYGDLQKVFAPKGWTLAEVDDYLLSTCAGVVYTFRHKTRFISIDVPMEGTVQVMDEPTSIVKSRLLRDTYSVAYECLDFAEALRYLTERVNLRIRDLRAEAKSRWAAGER
jgi:hypothetical protein